MVIYIFPQTDKTPKLPLKHFLKFPSGNDSLAILLFQIDMVFLLSKKEIEPQKIRVEFSLEDMDMSDFQKGATYGQINEYVKEQTGLSLSYLYIAQVKQKGGIIERENYNGVKQPKCPPDKDKAIMEALKHFQMIVLHQG